MGRTGDGKESAESLAKRITQAFRLFDSSRNDIVDVRELGTIIRSLGYNPTELQVRDELDGKYEGALQNEDTLHDIT
jgi:Ca2+-binding EF-hand superfamily protein